MALTKIPLKQTGRASVDTTSASDPTITSNKELGHVWANTTSGETYVCTNATTGANVWTNIGDGTGDIFPWEAMVAAGGDSITTDGDYKVHTFTQSGNFTVTEAGTDAAVQYLMVAGGGGGGSGYYNSSYGSGGGGAGGMITANNFSVSNGTYAIIIGAGGAGQAKNTNKTYSGSDSLFSTLIATGGGGGGPRSANNVADHGQSGGSGGGAAPGTQTWHGIESFQIHTLGSAQYFGDLTA